MRSSQLSMKFRTWGGRRKGAGRKPNGERPGVSHLRRPALASRFPVHVTLKMRREVYSLRSARCFRALHRCFLAGRDRFGFRLAHYSVQGNHIHLLVEGLDATALSRGMQGLGIRIACALNRVMKRRGHVLADRYHSRILRTPTEVVRARRYLRTNAEHHGIRRTSGVDPFASVEAVVAPRTWLLRRLE